MPAARVGPKTILSLCHEVDDLAEKIRELGFLGMSNLDARRRRAIRRIRNALHGPHKDAFRGRLRALQDAHGLSGTEVLLLLLLFNRRVRRRDPSSSGRDLLEAATPQGADVIQAAKLLHPDAALLRAGLVTGGGGAAEEVFDAEFRIGDRAYTALYRAFHGLEADLQDPDPTAPYPNGMEHFLDLRLLSDLAKRRAAKLFPMSSWGEWGGDEDRDPDELSERCAKLREIITAREKATPESVRLPIVVLRNEHGLGEDEELIVVTLLQHELFAARTTIELVELVRLVAASEAEAVRKRVIVAPESKLRQSGLIASEEEPLGKDLFASAWLPPGIAERLLGALDPKGAIGSEERTSFRRYLEGLRSSDDFYRRL
jgi:hypothetical protein